MVLIKSIGLSHKVDTIWYITLFCSLWINKDRSGHPYVSFWRHKGCCWLLWIKSWIFYCWILMRYLIPFQNGNKLVCSCSKCWATECDGLTHRPTNQRHVKIGLLRLSELELGLSWAIWATIRQTWNFVFSRKCSNSHNFLIFEVRILIYGMWTSNMGNFQELIWFLAKYYFLGI